MTLKWCFLRDFMNKKFSILVIIFLIVSSCMVFGRIAGNDFVNFDDQGYIVKNDHIKSGINTKSIQWAFTAVVLSNWHPFTLISHMLDCTLFGVNPSGHHLISLLLHIIAAIFLFLFFYKTTNNRWASAFVAAFFALHPLRVESVAWAAERKDVLSLFFGTATLYTYALYSESLKKSMYLLCLILFAFSLMSKPMMATLPFVLLLLDYWPLKKMAQSFLSAQNDSVIHGVVKLIREKVPFFILTILSCIMTFYAQNKEGAVASEDILSFFSRFNNAVIAYISYIGKILWPMNLAVYYPYDFAMTLWGILIAGIILIFITAIVVHYIRPLPFLFTGWFIYLGTLVPVIGFVQVGTQSMADRYTYLPSIGIAVMLAWGVPMLFRSENIRKKILLPAAAVILIVLSVLTWHQCGYWKNSSTLFSHALRVTQDNYVGHNRLASFLAERGNLNASIFHYNKALKIRQPQSSYAGNYIARGLVYAKLLMHQQAIDDFNNAISIKPDLAEAYYTRGTYYGKSRGQYTLAIDDLNEAIRLKPDYYEAFNNRGIILNILGAYRKAIDDFHQAIKLYPDYADAFNNKAF